MIAAVAASLRWADGGVGAGGLPARGLGVGEALRSLLPEAGVSAFAGLTLLGDSAVLLALAAIVYLGYDRRAGGFVAGALFAGYAVVIALKTAVAWPRPPPDLHLVAAAGYGFPSGHAAAATVGWGALAVALEGVWTARLRAVGAGGVIVAVALSRVVLGVHYLVDVLAGVGVGLAVLGAAAQWGRDDPRVLFAIGGGLAGVATATSGAAVDAVALLGACVGAVVAWPGPASAVRFRRGGLGVIAVAGAGAVVAAVAVAIGPVVALAFGVAAAATAGIVRAPAVASRRRGR